MPHEPPGVRSCEPDGPGDGWRRRRERWAGWGGPGTLSPALLSGELVVLAAYLVTARVIEANPFADALLNGTHPPRGPAAGGLRTWLVVLWLATVGLFAAGGAYRQRLHLSVWEELPTLSWRAVAALVTVAAVTGYADGGATRGAVLVLGLAGLGSQLAIRLGVTGLLREARAGRRAASRTLVLGGGTLSFKAVELLDAEPELGLAVLGYLDDVPAPLSYGPAGWTYLGQVSQLPEVVRRLRIQAVLVGFGAGSDGLAAQALCRLGGDPRVQVFAVPRLFELGRRPLGQDHAGPIPLTRVRVAATRGPRWAAKRATDIAAAVLGLAVTGPLMLVLAVAVRLECGPGPVVVTREHVGRRGATVRLRRFRTGRPGLGPGPVGRWLRGSWVGRLPVLWNLLAGDLSLVGPRPVTPPVSQRLQRMLPHYEHRLQVRGGLVGPEVAAPCAGEPPADEAVLYDTAYVENWGPWTDATVLMHGMRRLLGRYGRNTTRNGRSRTVTGVRSR